MLGRHRQAGAAVILPLLTSPTPDVAFAAARAAAFIGDPTAPQATLLDIARTTGQPVPAQRGSALGELPTSPPINAMLRQLLDSDKALVRIEAYKVLARNKDTSIYSKS